MCGAGSPSRAVLLRTLALLGLAAVLTRGQPADLKAAYQAWQREFDYVFGSLTGPAASTAGAPWAGCVPRGPQAAE